MSAASRSSPSERKLRAASRATFDCSRSPSGTRAQYARRPAASCANPASASACALARNSSPCFASYTLRLTSWSTSARNFRRTSGRRQRAQFEPLRGRVQPRLATQLGEARERVGRLSALERELRLEHEARHREIRRMRIGPLEHRGRRGEVARFERGARADQRRHGRRLRNRERFLRELARLAVAAFEQRDDRGILLGAKALELAPAPSLAHFLRQLRKAHRRADQRVQRDERQQRDDDERVLRKLDAVRRRHEQHVTGVETEQERERHRRRGDDDERDQRAHGASSPTCRPPRHARRAPRRPSTYALRRGSRRDRASHPASRSPKAARASRASIALAGSAGSKYCLSQSRAADRSALNERSSRASSARRAERSRSRRFSRRKNDCSGVTQRRRRPVGDLDADHAAQIVPDALEEPQPRGIVRRNRRRRRRADALVLASGSASIASIIWSSLIEMPATSTYGTAFSRSMSRASARRSGPSCGRSSRASLLSATCSPASAACTLPPERKLLARQHENLLDLGQRKLVARRREIAIQRFERRLLRLKLGNARVEQVRASPVRRAARSQHPIRVRAPARRRRRRPSAAARYRRAAIA